MSWIAVGTAAVGVFNGAKQANDTMMQAQLTSSLNGINAEYDQVNADRASEQGYTQQARYQSVIDNMVGSQKEAEAASNVNVNYGTAAQLQANTQATGYLNQLDMIAQARAKSLGFTYQAQNARYQSSVQMSQGEINANAAGTSALINGATTILGNKNNKGDLLNELGASPNSSSTSDITGYTDANFTMPSGL